MLSAALQLACLAWLLVTVHAQLNISLYSDSNCLTPLPPSALLFNSVQAWSSLSTSQLVPAFQSLSGSGIPPASNLTASSCQSTTALQQAGVGVGVYSCAPVTSGPGSSPNTTLVYSGVIALAEWPASNTSACPAQAASAPQQLRVLYSRAGVGDAYACTRGTLTTPASSTPTTIYAIVNQACQPTTGAAGRVEHCSWSMYGVLLALAVASVSLA